MNTLKYSSSSITAVRVFISSTFFRMKPVREYLRLHVFPTIELAYKKAGVGFMHIDLQWGITAEQAMEGRTFELCMGEISRCQPFFIGLLGSYYGWCPTIAECTFTRQDLADFFRRHQGKSLTEMEFLYNATFPDYCENSAIFCIDPSIELQEERDHDDKNQLRRFKQEMEKLYAGRVYRDIDSFQKLGEYVTDVLLHKLAQIKAGNAMSEEYQQVYREQQLLAAHYDAIGFRRHQQLDAALRYIRDGGKPMVVTGSAGYGKSTFLSNLYMQLRSMDCNVVIRFFKDDDQWCCDLWESITQELKLSDQWYSSLTDTVKNQTASDQAKYRADIVSDITIRKKHRDLKIKAGSFTENVMLNAVAGIRSLSRKTVLLIDDADRYHFGAQISQSFLDCITRVLPENLRLIVTAGKGSYERAQYPGWQFLQLGCLAPAEKTAAVTELAAYHGKSLSAAENRLICSSDRTAEPAYLFHVIKLLSLHAVFEDLNQQIRRYTHMTDVDELLVALVCEGIGSAPAKEMLTYITVSKTGLTERELAQLCPRLNTRDFHHILGVAAEMIYYDAQGHIRITNSALTAWLLKDRSCVYLARRRLLKKLRGFSRSDIVSNVIEKAYQLFCLEEYDKLAAHLADFGNTVILSSMCYSDWMRYMCVLYPSGRAVAVMEKTIREMNVEQILLYGSTLMLYADVLRHFRSYQAAAQLLWLLEGEYAAKFGEFNYINSVYYSELLKTYTDADDIFNGILLSRHLAFMLSNNKQLPPVTHMLRFSFCEPLYYFGKKSGMEHYCEAARNIAAAIERLDGVSVYFSDRRMTATGEAWVARTERLDLTNYYDSVFILVGTPVYSPEEGYRLLTSAEKSVRLDRAEFELLLLLSGRTLPAGAIRKNCALLEHLERRGLLIIHRKHDYFGLYQKLKGYTVFRKGTAVGEQPGRDYVIYRFRGQPVQLEEPEYTAWIYSNGQRTAADLCQCVLGLFKDPDTMKIQKEVAQSMVLLYQNGLLALEQGGGA